MSIRISTEKPDQRSPPKNAISFIADETPRRSIGTVGMTISLEGCTRISASRQRVTARFAEQHGRHPIHALRTSPQVHALHLERLGELQAFASTLVEVLAVQVLPLIGLALRLDGGGKRWTPSVPGLFVPVAAFIPVVGVAWARRASVSCRVGAWLAFLAM